MDAHRVEAAAVAIYAEVIDPAGGRNLGPDEIRKKWAKAKPLVRERHVREARAALLAAAGFVE